MWSTDRLHLVTTSPVQLALPIDYVERIGLARHDSTPAPAPAAVRRQMERWGATEAFDLYWQFAEERQRMFLRRLGGQAPPWTTDDILARFRFTNPYRFSDRVSQFLLQNVQYDKPRSPESIVLRTLLFKIFNRVDTWQSLVEESGDPTTDSFELTSYSRILAELRAKGRRIYSPAYIIPNPAFGAQSKHENHLLLLARMLGDGTINRIVGARSLEELYVTLREVPSFGPFLAFQYAVDVNYSSVTDADEGQFVVAGPGAKGGIRKCFTSFRPGQEEEVIMWVAESQREHFSRLGLEFPMLAGRPLQPIDCQNLFCEIDKYTRVSHPQLTLGGGRLRIKQIFETRGRLPLLPLFVPPKWRDGRISLVN
jgi:hypothetical protein